MSQSLDPFQELLGRHVEKLAKAVQTLIAAKGLNVLVRNGAWSNENGVIVAYVSYYPSTTTLDKALEAVISLTRSTSQAFFEADICHPDGEIIQEVFRRVISYDNLDSLLIEADKLCQEACEGFFAFFVREI